MTRIAVIGGGITGQMAQWAMPHADVYDWKPRPTTVLTRNYGGNYLWKPISHDGVTCRPFSVITEIDGKAPTMAAAKAYKAKIGKDMEHPGLWEMQFKHKMPGWDFVTIPDSRIHYQHRLTGIHMGRHVLTFENGTEVVYDALISTIPLYSLLSMVGMEPIRGLKFAPIYVKKYPAPERFGMQATNPLGFYINYLSTPDIESYRYTDRDGERHYESLIPLSQPMTKLSPGKIWDHKDVPDVLRHLANFDIHPIGRYGQWDSNQLVHETWDTIQLLKKVLA